MAPPQSTQSVCLGRLNYEVDSQMALISRTHRMYKSGIRTVKTTESKGLDALWGERLVYIKSLTAPSSSQQALRSATSPDTNTRRGVYHTNTMAKDVITVEQMHAFDDHVLWIDVEGRVSTLDKVNTLIKGIEDGYKPHSTEGFCLEHGSLTGQPSRYEEAKATYKHSDADIELRISTRTLDTPSSGSPSDTIRANAKAFASQGVQINVLHDEPRKVGHMNGAEVYSSITTNGETQVKYLWLFHGKGGEAEAPRVAIEASAPLAQKELLHRVWEPLLNSFNSP